MADEPSASDAELMAQIEAELKKLKVLDVLVQSLYTVSSLAWRSLDAEQRDLEEARLAIEALRALIPVLEPALPEGATKDFAQVVANLQLAYAKSAAEASNAAGDDDPGV